MAHEGIIVPSGVAVSGEKSHEGVIDSVCVGIPGAAAEKTIIVVIAGVVGPGPRAVERAAGSLRAHGAGAINRHVFFARVFPRGSVPRCIGCCPVLLLFQSCRVPCTQGLPGADVDPEAHQLRPRPGAIGVQGSHAPGVIHAFSQALGDARRPGKGAGGDLRGQDRLAVRFRIGAGHRRQAVIDGLPCLIVDPCPRFRDREHHHPVLLRPGHPRPAERRAAALDQGHAMAVAGRNGCRRPFLSRQGKNRAKQKRQHDQCPDVHFSSPRSSWKEPAAAGSPATSFPCLHHSRRERNVKNGTPGA